ncbi:MAG: hypothetical protein LC792_23255 [Actinobacteria bacterium]|nr:hypothetical protein [Actinomycetota bacterium]
MRAGPPHEAKAPTSVATRTASARARIGSSSAPDGVTNTSRSRRPQVW